jgi:hypothetical protein
MAPASQNRKWILAKFAWVHSCGGAVAPLSMSFGSCAHDWKQLVGLVVPLVTMDPSITLKMEMYAGLHVFSSADFTANKGWWGGNIGSRYFLDGNRNLVDASHALWISCTQPTQLMGGTSSMKALRLRCHLQQIATTNCISGMTPSALCPHTSSTVGNQARSVRLGFLKIIKQETR